MPSGRYITVAATAIHQANASGCAPRRTSMFQSAWKTAARRTRPTAVGFNRRRAYHAPLRRLGMATTTQPAKEVGTKLMFENERVRVWDLSLAPGEQLAKHIHAT